jgi:hypothetical protein
MGWFDLWLSGCGVEGVGVESNSLAVQQLSNQIMQGQKLNVSTAQHVNNFIFPRPPQLNRQHGNITTT